MNTDLRPAHGDESGCHPEPVRFAQSKLREGYAVPTRGELIQILRFAQNDRLSRELPLAFGPRDVMKISLVVPAKAGTHFRSGTQWIPAFAGMTSRSLIFGGAEREICSCLSFRFRQQAKCKSGRTQDARFVPKS